MPAGAQTTIPADSDTSATTETFANFMPAVKTIGKLIREGKKKHDGERERVGRGGQRGTEEEKKQNQRRTERGPEPKRTLYALVCDHALHSSMLPCVC